MKPGARGTKRYVTEYGDRLVCVRYGHDGVRRKRFTTVEIIVAEADLPGGYTGAAKAKYPHHNQQVFVRVGYQETQLQRLVKQAGGQWEKERKLWRLRRHKVIELGLRDRIVKAEEDGAGEVWEAEVPGYGSQTYRLTGMKSPTDIEDDLANLGIWVWSAKDYIKRFVQARGGEPSTIEQYVDSNPDLPICADIANSAKHAVLSQSRTGRFFHAGKPEFQIPQAKSTSMSYGRNSLRFGTHWWIAPAMKSATPSCICRTVSLRGRRFFSDMRFDATCLRYTAGLKSKHAYLPRCL